LRSQYRFDYAKARPNRFAGKSAKDRVVVVLDADVGKVFRSGKSVNNALRALLSVMPQERD